jgi:hypothetical protein
LGTNLRYNFGKTIEKDCASVSNDHFAKKEVASLDVPGSELCEVWFQRFHDLNDLKYCFFSVFLLKKLSDLKNGVHLAVNFFGSFSCYPGGRWESLNELFQSSTVAMLV